MPTWRHSATHAAHGRGERRGGCAPSRAERATRLSSAWSVVGTGGGLVMLRSLARKTAPDGARTAGGVARDARCGQTVLTHVTCRHERWRGGCLELQPRTTHTHTHIHTIVTMSAGFKAPSSHRALPPHAAWSGSQHARMNMHGPSQQSTRGERVGASTPGTRTPTRHRGESCGAAPAASTAGRARGARIPTVWNMGPLGTHKGAATRYSLLCWLPYLPSAGQVEMASLTAIISPSS